MASFSRVADDCWGSAIKAGRIVPQHGRTVCGPPGTGGPILTLLAHAFLAVLAATQADDYEPGSMAS